MAASSLAKIVGRSEFSKSYILQALWWLKSPMRDAKKERRKEGAK
jgi:hypothetical protein